MFLIWHMRGRSSAIACLSHPCLNALPKLCLFCKKTFNKHALIISKHVECRFCEWLTVEVIVKDQLRRNARASKKAIDWEMYKIA